MSDYCKCSKCKYIDPTETYGSQWWCEYYHEWEDPDEIKECTRFERIGSSTGCFLTTVCCIEKGLPDNCYELTQMRRLRDEVLSNSEVGKSIIDFYYEEAPRIVDQINKSKDKKTICDWIYREITEVNSLFEKGLLSDAGSKYLLMMYRADLMSSKS